MQAQPISSNSDKKELGYADKKSRSIFSRSLFDDSGDPSSKAISGETFSKTNVSKLLILPDISYPIVFRTSLDLVTPYLVTDNIKIDCVWVDSFDYYAIWDSEKLNPYGFDGLKMKDTVRLELVSDKVNDEERSPLDASVVTSDFGLRKAEWHYGTDIRVKIGTPVYAPFDGIVRINQFERHGYGRYLMIRHKNGLETLYGHLSRTVVNVGDIVKAGDIIGYGGSTGHSTGPHLHFEVRYEGNAINPNDIYDFSTDKLKDSVLTITPSTFAYLAEARAIRFVRVRRGDTLSGIGYRCGITVSKLCRLNRLSRKSILRIGQKIRIN